MAATTSRVVVSKACGLESCLRCVYCGSCSDIDVYCIAQAVDSRLSIEFPKMQRNSVCLLHHISLPTSRGPSLDMEHEPPTKYDIASDQKSKPTPRKTARDIQQSPPIKRHTSRRVAFWYYADEQHGNCPSFLAWNDDYNRVTHGQGEG